MRFTAPPLLRRAAQRARIASARRRRPSGVMPPLLFAEPPLLFAAPPLFLAEPPVLLPEPPLVLAETLGIVDAELSPRAAQRARAAAASFARVAGDIGRRRPSCFAPPDAPLLFVPPLLDVLPPPPLLARPLVPLLLLPLLPPPKSELSRSSNAWICSRSETASFNLSRDKSMGRY